MARGSFFNAGSILTIGYAAEHVLLFVRILLVARFLGPEYFGISVTFLLIVSTFQLLSDLGFEKYVIQAREPDYLRSRDTLATLILVRGLLMGASIILLAHTIAGLFGYPDIAWFYAIAAVIPIIEGFRHIDPLAQQRQMQFAPFVMSQLGGMVPGVLLTIVLAYATQNYVAIAAGCALTSLVTVILSHLLATRPYRLGLDRPALRDILVYGWPLLLNGIVIFLSTQGDRIVVGALAGMRDLAGYAAMAAVTGSAAVLFNRICTNLLLPLLSEARDDPGLYVARARTTAAGTFLAVSLFLFPIATLGGPLVFLLFGDGYYTSPLLAAFLTVVASSVVVRSWCNANLLSLGGTRDILMANILRAGGLALAFAALRAGYGIVGVAAGICAGDVAASCLANWRVATRVPAIARTCALLAGALLAGAALLIAVNSRLDPFADPITTLAVVVLTTLPWAAAVLALSRDLRGRIAVVWETARERLGWPAG